PADGGETIALDGQPFGGSFPTSDWAAGMRVRDDWDVSLPDNLAPGAYDVYTGLYDPASGERAVVRGGDDQPLTNNVIPLGRIDFAPSTAGDKRAEEAL